MDGLKKMPAVVRTNIKPQYDMFSFADGHAVMILAEGRLPNLGCATGHPSFGTIPPRHRSMMNLEEAKRILSAFAHEGVEYVLIGSMAMAAQGLVRATRDLDFFVSPAPDNVRRLKQALRMLFDGDPNVDESRPKTSAANTRRSSTRRRTGCTRSTCWRGSARPSATRRSNGRPSPSTASPFE